LHAASRDPPGRTGDCERGKFFELLNGLAQGQPWDFAEFAKRLAAFSSPTGLGVALIVDLEVILRRGRVRHARSLRFPGQPWLWEPMWAERRGQLSNRKALAACLTALGDYAFVLMPVGLWMASQKVGHARLGLQRTVGMMAMTSSNQVLQPNSQHSGRMDGQPWLRESSALANAAVG
jgi:hypothetical protein